MKVISHTSKSYYYSLKVAVCIHYLTYPSNLHYDRHYCLLYKEGKTRLREARRLT